MPPISALTAFDAVVRRGGFTAAAEELALTQSAVSRQVSALEHLLGVELLEPNRRRQVAVTASGAFYAEQIQKLLSQLVAATTEAIALGDRGRTLRLGIPPAFGSLWLMPRMPSFFAAYPDVAVEFSTRIPSQHPSGLGDLHALVNFAAVPATDAEWEKFMELQLRPVATGQIAEALRQSDHAGLANVHLLVHTSERGNLSEVLDDHPQLKLLRSRPMITFESYTMLVQAAIGGIGIALAPAEFVQADLSAKRLVPIADWAIKGRSDGYLIYNRAMGAYPPLAAFRAWLFDSIKPSGTAAKGRKRRMTTLTSE